MTHSPPTAASRRALLLLGTALAALAAMPGAAHGQAFDGFAEVVGGDAGFAYPAPGREIVTIRSPSAVINWRRRLEGAPPPGGWTFLRNGNEATFEGPQGFAVLNRLLPFAGESVIIDGTILGRLAGANAPTANGTVAFYTPNGLIIGGNAVFDVGSLILTTLNPQFNAAGQFIGPGGTITFQNTDVPNSTVTTLAGSQITAGQEGSYVVFAAPGITHGGSVRVNGSAAYVAAGGAVVTHNAGLFDIQVTVGTTVDTPLVHTGATGGPASNGAGVQQNIVMRAVSDDEAITALIGGQIGYDAPLSAAIENGLIVISAEVRNSAPDQPQRATLALNDGNFTSDVRAESSHDATVTGDIAFSQDLTLAGARTARLSVDQGQIITVGGNLTLTSDSSVATFAGDDRTGGDVRMTAANGGRIQVAGDASVLANGIGQFNTDTNLVGNGTGGTAAVEANSGTIQIGGNLSIAADGRTVTPPVTPSAAGAGTGGTASLLSSADGTVSIGGVLNVLAVGVGSQGGGAGQGGTARVVADGASVQVLGTANSAVVTNAVGGSGSTGGSARGGTLTLQVENGGAFTSAGQVGLSAEARGGIGTIGGEGRGGLARVGMADGVATFGNGLGFSVAGFGGATTATGAGTGGAAFGGDAILDVSGTTGRAVVTGALGLSTGAFGGGSTAAATLGGQTGGSASGGNALVQVAGGAGVTVSGGTTLFSNGHSGTAATPGIANGGSAVIRASGAGSFVTLANGQLQAFGFVANSGPATAVFGGGTGSGGRALVEISGGAIVTTNNLTVNAGAEQGTTLAITGRGGNLQGGTATVDVNGGILRAAQLSLFNGARGGVGINGGEGRGGTSQVLVRGGGSASLGDLIVHAFGFGGFTSAAGAGAGGAAFGGRALLDVSGSGTQVQVTGSLNIASGAFGGGSNAATPIAGQTGGAALGGTASMLVTDGALMSAPGQTAIQTNAHGGIAATPGSATGGASSLIVSNLGSRSDFGTISLSANAHAADEGPATTTLTGAPSTGGRAQVTVNPGAAVTAISLSVSASALQGRALATTGAAGNGLGGASSVEIIGGRLGVTQGLSLLSNGRGNNGSGTAAGGSGRGGTAMLSATAGSSLTANRGITITTLSSGGTGAGGAGGGDGFGGTASLIAQPGGAVTSGDAITVTAGAQGGAATGSGNGGSAAAGTAIMRADGGIIQSNAGAIPTTVSANATGGSGAIGGAARGGTARLEALNGGTIGFPTTLRVMSTAGGGSGTTAGGLGQGLTASVTVGPGGGSVQTAGALIVDMIGVGGAGGTSGGEARGGAGTISVSSGGSVTAAGGGMFARAFGGNGTSGGTATGGSVVLDVAAGGNFSSNAGGSTTDFLVSATPGTGGAPAATAGSVTIASNGTTTFNSLAVRADAAGSAGGGGTISLSAGNGGSFAFGAASVSATGSGPSPNAGGIRLTNLAGTALSSSLAATTDGPLDALNVSAAQNIALTSSAGALTATNVTAGQALSLATASGSLTATNNRAGAAATLTTGSGALVVNGLDAASASLTSGSGAVDARAVTITGDATVTSTNGNIAVTDLNAGGTAAIRSASGSVALTRVRGGAGLTGDAGTTLTSADVTSGANITLASGDTLTVSNVAAPQALSLTSRNGALNATNVRAGTTATLTTGVGALNATTVAGGTTVALISGAGTLTANGVTGGGATLTTGGGALNASNVNVTGAAALNSGTGNLIVTNVTAGTAATLGTTSGTLTATGITAPTIALTTGSGALVASNLTGQTLAATSATGGVNVTGASAAQSLALATAGTVTLAGAVASPRINVDSSDIAIAAGTNLGGAGSQVTLTVRPNGAQTVFGGATQGPGYTLDGAEANRIQTANLTLFVPASGAAANRPADLVVRDVTLEGSRVTALRLQTPGIVQVDGSLLIANAGGANSVTVDGTSPAQRVSFVTPGSIRLRDATGAAAGTLTVDARDIWVADAATLGQLLANRNFVGRDLALLTPAATFAPRGYLEGQNVVLRPAESLFVQNSGTLRAFGGITVGGTLAIQGGGAAGPADVTAFGRRVNAAGTSAGTPFFFQVNFGGQFTNGSEFNTCIINPRLCSGGGGGGGGGGAGLPRGDIDGGIDGGDVGEGGDEGGPRRPRFSAGGDLISDAALSEPLIEEPVTSGGDSSAWTEQQCSPESSAPGSSDTCADGDEPIAPPTPEREQRP